MITESTKPTFSIVIPVFNTEKYLKECVESILNQAYDSYEIILVDDGSKDSTVYLCNEWIAKNRALFDHTEVIGDGINRGTCKNLILALQHLKTDLFFLLAGDKKRWKNSP